MDPSAAPRTTAHSVTDDAGIDLPAALKRLGGDQQLLRDMALIFVQDAPGLLEQAQAGRSPADPDPSWRAAHSLKGLASNFSDSAAAAAQSAEEALRAGDPQRIEPAMRDLCESVERLIGALQRTVLR